MHTESSLKVLEDVTIALGQDLRYFAEETCKHFKTVETDKEFAARTRAETRRQAKQGVDKPSTGSTGKRSATFSLETVKHHAMGDYVEQIKMFGTTDSFTTQIVCDHLYCRNVCLI
jgi:hypothetical protein